MLHLCHVLAKCSCSKCFCFLKLILISVDHVRFWFCSLRFCLSLCKARWFGKTRYLFMPFYITVTVMQYLRIKFRFKNKIIVYESGAEPKFLKIFFTLHMGPTLNYPLTHPSFTHTPPNTHFILSVTDMNPFNTSTIRIQAFTLYGKPFCSCFFFF